MYGTNLQEFWSGRIYHDTVTEYVGDSTSLAACCADSEQTYRRSMSMTALLNDEIMGILVSEQEIIKKTAAPNALTFKERGIEDRNSCGDTCTMSCTGGCSMGCTGGCGWSCGDCSDRCLESCGDSCSDECGWLDD